MRHRSIPWCLFSVVLLIAAGVLWRTAQAGPPLICHPLEIGERASLPWGEDAFAKVTKFKRGELLEQTVKLLDEEDSPLVHMETLRRAMLYAEEKESDALALLACLLGRALDAEGEGREATLALLDAGYVTQGLEQLGVGAKLSLGEADGIAGYRWIRQAIERQPDDAELQFAAAVVTALAANDAHRHHVQRVKELSEAQSLVRRNLDNRPHFGR